MKEKIAAVIWFEVSIDNKNWICIKKEMTKYDFNEDDVCFNIPIPEGYSYARAIIVRDE